MNPGCIVFLIEIACVIRIENADMLLIMESKVTIQLDKGKNDSKITRKRGYSVKPITKKMRSGRSGDGAKTNNMLRIIQGRNFGKGGG